MCIRDSAVRKAHQRAVPAGRGEQAVPGVIREAREHLERARGGQELLAVQGAALAELFGPGALQTPMTLATRTKCAASSGATCSRHSVLGCFMAVPRFIRSTSAGRERTS